MDAVTYKRKALELFKKYKFVFLVFLIGLFLMVMPESPQAVQDIPSETVAETATLQESLAQILRKIDGAGSLEVLLTEASGAQTYYQADEDFSSGGQGTDRRNDTVLVTNSAREEEGLVQRVDPPVYLGAVVVCQGADNARVRLSIVEAVSNATGLSTNKISVLKMK